MAKPTLADIMITPVVRVAPNCGVGTALALMEQKETSALVVTEGATAVGIISAGQAMLARHGHEQADALTVYEAMSTSVVTLRSAGRYRRHYVLRY